MFVFWTFLVAFSFFICSQERAYLGRVNELDAITSDRDGKRSEYEALRKERLDTFMHGFTIITTKLKEMYQVGPSWQFSEVRFTSKI